MNNSINATTEKSLIELVFRATLHQFPSPEDLAKPIQDATTISDYLQQIQANVAIARDCHTTTKTKQTTYANRKCHPDLKYKVEDKAYLETKDSRLSVKQKERSTKFYSHYVGPFEIYKSQPETSNYMLKLLLKCQIHPKVYAHDLKPAYDNDLTLFPGCVAP